MADTMQMGDQSCAVLYVDAGIGGGAGDGSTPAVALVNIPAVGSLASNTVYLCRRTLSNAITMTSGTLATGDHIYLVGMPKSTDWLYERAPAAAKAAWDADADDYALANTSAYNTTFQLSPIDNCGFHRLKIVRVSPTSGNGASRHDVTLQLDVRANYTGSEYCTNGMYFFTNNWWGDAYAKDLSDPTWLTNTQYASGGMSFQYARSVKFCNNHIEFNGYYNGNAPFNYSVAVYINYVRHLVANDNEFWFSSFGGTGNNFYGFWNNSYYYQTTVEFCRNNVYLVAQNYTVASFYNPIQIQGKDIYSHDVALVIDRYYNRSGITSAGYISTGIVYYGCSGSSQCPGKWDIQNISADSGDICNLGQLIYLYYVAYQYRGASAPYFSSIIKNITSKCAPNSALPSSTNVACGSSYAGHAFLCYLPPEFSPVENITAYHAMSSGIYSACDLTETTAYWTKGPVLKNCDIKGTITALNTGFLHVTNWTCASAPAADKLTIWSSTVYIAAATIDPGNAWAAQQWLRIRRAYFRVIIDSIDVLPYVYWESTPAYDDCVLINNVDGVTGKWWGSDYYYTGQSWGAYRTGGANASIKLAGTISDVHFTHLEIALPPFRGLEWTPGGTGQGTAIIHVAHKLMTNPTYLQKRFKALVLVPYWTGTEYQPKTYLSDVDGKLVDDSASTWNNETGLTQLKFEIPFPVTEADQVVTVRLFYDWYDPTGYMYVDPLVEFTLV